jgi:hypothetical protein
MIGKLPPIKLAQSATITPNSQIEKSSQATSLISAEINPSHREDAVKLDKAVKFASKAIQEIVKLRERQSAILEQMTSANDSKRSKLLTAYNEIDSEITRIGATAYYGDINIISGQSFSIQSGKELFSESLVLPNLSPLTTSYLLNKTDQSVNSTKASISAALSSAYLAYSGFESRSDKTAKILSEINHLGSLPNDGTKRNYFRSAPTTSSSGGTRKLDATTAPSPDEPAGPSDIDLLI